MALDHPWLQPVADESLRLSMATAVEPAVALRREATRELRRKAEGGRGSRASLTAVLAATRMRIGGEENGEGEAGRGIIRLAVASHGLSSAARSPPPKGKALSKALASTKRLPIKPKGTSGGDSGGGGGAAIGVRSSGKSPRTPTGKPKRGKAAAAAEETADPMSHYTPIYKGRNKASFDIDEQALEA